MFPLWGGVNPPEGPPCRSQSPHPLAAKNDIDVSPHLVLTPPAPLAVALRFGSGTGVSLGMSAIGGLGLGWGEGAVFGLGLDIFLGGWGGGAFLLGAGGSFLCRTGESAKQAGELEARETREEEKFVEHSKEGSAEDPP